MAYDAARPRYTLPFGEKSFELIGTFGLIEAVEHAMQEGIIQLAARVMEMGMTDTAKLVAALASASGSPLKSKDAGEAIFNEIGLNSEGFVLLKLHLNAFLNILFAPPKDREEKARALGEQIGRWAAPASLGKTTSASA